MTRWLWIGLTVLLPAAACSNDGEPASTETSPAAGDTSSTSTTGPETTATADTTAEADASDSGGSGTAFTILEWNITGGEVAANVAIVEDVFATEDTDIVVLQETNRGAATIADILGDVYTQAAELDGQEIWIKDDGRFIVREVNVFDFEGGCNGFDLGTPSVALGDTESNEFVHLYSTHLCIPDGFGGATAEPVDALADISNENQQQHMCSLVESMEINAVTGTVVLAADFNDINLSAGESIVEFLQGSGSLNAGFCESPDLGMTEVVVTDVTRIMGSGSSDMYSSQHSVTSNDVGFGQHGYVVAAIDLSAAPNAS